MTRLYEILDIEQTATQGQVKEAFYSKMRELKLKKQDVEFDEYQRLEKELKEAYEVLGNKGRRKEYDKISPLSQDMCSITKEIKELKEFYDSFVKQFVDEMAIPEEHGYSSKITGQDEMQVTFKNQEEIDSFVELAAVKFPTAGFVRTDAEGNKERVTFPQLVKEKREKEEKERMEKDKELKNDNKSENKSDLASQLLEGARTAPRLAPSGPGASAGGGGSG